MSAFEHSKIDQDLYVKSPTDSSVEGGGGWQAGHIASILQFTSEHRLAATRSPVTLPEPHPDTFRLNVLRFYPKT